MYGDRKIQWRAGKRKTLEEGLLTVDTSNGRNRL
jgi:hypothetical protein